MRAILRRLEVDKQIERGADWGRRFDRGALKIFWNAGYALSERRRSNAVL